MPRTGARQERIAAIRVSPWISKHDKQPAGRDDDAQNKLNAGLRDLDLSKQVQSDEAWDPELEPVTRVPAAHDTHLCSAAAALCVQDQEDACFCGYVLGAAEVMSRVECQQEDDWAMLLVQLRNYSTKQHVRLLAEKGGGDAMRLQPPRDPSLLNLIGVDSIKGMPEMHFACHTLKVGDAAQLYQQRFHPETEGVKSTEGVECMVNLGQVQLAGLPPGFLQGT